MKELIFTNEVLGKKFKVVGKVDFDETVISEVLNTSAANPTATVLDITVGTVEVSPLVEVSEPVVEPTDAVKATVKSK